MNNLDVILEKAKARVRARGYSWEKLLTLSRAMKIAIEAGLFDTFNARVKTRDRKRAVEAFVAGKKIGEWDSIKSGALAMNANKSSVASCAAGKTYSAGRYNGNPIIWRFKK